ncbi:MAG: hypothetical protein V1872_10620 [bacterium]
MVKDFSIEIAYVETHKEELIKEYLNKFILINGQKIVGSFDSYQHAAEEGLQLFGEDGKFYIHQVLEKEPVNFIMEATL